MHQLTLTCICQPQKTSVNSAGSAGEEVKRSGNKTTCQLPKAKSNQNPASPLHPQTLTTCSQPSEIRMLHRRCTRKRTTAIPPLRNVLKHLAPKKSCGGQRLPNPSVDIASQVGPPQVPGARIACSAYIPRARRRRLLSTCARVLALIRGPHSGPFPGQNERNTSLKNNAPRHHIAQISPCPQAPADSPPGQCPSGICPKSTQR